MKIIRNGQEIELTHEEMRQAYYEMKDEYTIEDIRSIYNLSEDKIDEALTIFERVVGNNDNFWDSYWLMIDFVAEEMGLEERNDQTMITYNVGFVNTDGVQDETQLDIEERNSTDEEVIELMNLILSLKDEMNIKEVAYIECLEYEERED